MLIYSKKSHGYSVCVLDVLTADAYQKIAKIADHQVSVQIVVGKSVAAGILLTNQQQLISTHRTHCSLFMYCFFISVSYSGKYCFICSMLKSFVEYKNRTRLLNQTTKISHTNDME